MELGEFEIEMIHHDPIVFTVENILSDSECDHFKKIASNDMKRSLVSGTDESKSQRGLLDKRRTSSDCWISHSIDHITLKVGERISELVQVHISNAEALQV